MFFNSTKELSFDAPLNIRLLELEFIKETYGETELVMQVEFSADCCNNVAVPVVFSFVDL